MRADFDECLIHCFHKNGNPANFKKNLVLLKKQKLSELGGGVSDWRACVCVVCVRARGRFCKSCVGRSTHACFDSSAFQRVCVCACVCACV